MGGSSDMTSAPVSQNQLVTSAPHHSRLSPRMYLISAPVEAKMLRLMTRFGAPSPVGGMNRLATQQATDDTIISQAKLIGAPPTLAAKTATILAGRVAVKGR